MNSVTEVFSFISHVQNHWDSFEFLYPWMLAFLPLPWLIRSLLKPVPKKQHPLLAPHIVARLQAHLPQQTQLIQPQRHGKIALGFIILWLLLILAALRPIWFLTPTPFHISGKELMLAVDLSGSMQKADMYLGGDDVDRLTAVKSVVANFIEQRQGDRMGLIVFGTQAFLQSPLTYDLTTLNTLLAETQIGMAGNNTAIGDAIGLTLKHLRQKQNTQAVLILLTDGSNTAGTVEPIAAAQKAQTLGLKIYTIGVGRMTDRTGLDRFLGSKTDMDIATLEQIAQLTQGRFYHANDTQQLAQIYQEINQLESVEHQVNSYRLRTELYVWPLGAAFVLSLILAFGHLRHQKQQGS
ncbi:VWA domain-containing protein [Thiomicrorhabdus aquaedulcis]|uniref:VWA domain-containing protein n=1 Tax=Thiomicrorhabdus aquaedulcis TaxID=2211106 RepID=UPI000FD9CCFB|nr:VWA domain-containing protein [Thiomicrorhabdus aquaedulcis]